MLAILYSLNVHNLTSFQLILMILVSKFMVYRVLSDKTYSSLGLLFPLTPPSHVCVFIEKRIRLPVHQYARAYLFFLQFSSNNVQVLPTIFGFLTGTAMHAHQKKGPQKRILEN